MRLMLGAASAAVLVYCGLAIVGSGSPWLLLVLTASGALIGGVLGFVRWALDWEGDDDRNWMETP